MRDIEGLASSALADLVTTFEADFLEQTGSAVVAPPMQFLVIEGLVNEGHMEVEVASALGLDFETIVKVDSTSTSENACNVVGRVSIVEDATLETSTPIISRGSVPVPGEGKEASGGASSSMSLSEAIARVANQLRD